LLTAEWEQQLGEVERGNLDPADFMDGIAALVRDLILDYQPVPGAEVLFPSERETVGICPRCGANLNEGPCSCAEAAPAEDGPFAALRNLKLED
jgi:DNA topoisomerase-3